MLKRIFTWDFLASVSIFVFTLTIYIITLSRSVYYGDSGEFIAAAATLGIAHPPGYPLYTMLAHLFTYLPFGNLPFRVNLFSAVTSSLTVVTVYFICLKLTKSRLASISASLFLAFSYLFWLYALVAEVFSLHTLFVSLLILISLHIFENPTNKKLFYFLSFIFALSLTNHHATLFLIPALLFLIFSTNPKLLLQPKFLILNTLFLILGLLPYLYLPLRSSQHPILAWGDQTTLNGFLHHFLRRDYGTFGFGAGALDNPFNFNVLAFYFSSLFWYFAGIGIIMAGLGFIFSFRQKRSGFFLILIFLFAGPIFVFLSRLSIVGNIDSKGALERFFLTSQIILVLWIGFGFSEIFSNIPRTIKWLANLTIFLFLILLILNFSKVDQSKNFISEDFGRKTFEILPQNSVVFVFGDRLSMISKYLQTVEGLRPDVKMLNITFLPDDWYKKSTQKLHPNFEFPYDKFQPLKLSEIEAGEIICQELLAKYPVFIENRVAAFNPQNNKYCTNGLYKNIWKLEPREYQMSLEYLLSEYENFWQTQIQSLSSKKPADLRTRSSLLYSFAQPLTYLGVFLDENFRLPDKAHEVYQNAFAISSDNAIALYLTARKYLAEKDFETAKNLERQALKINPTLAEPYRVLGLLSLDLKQDKKAALEYFKQYLEFADENFEKERTKNLVKELIQELEK